jgi:hypothetical protein
MTGAFVANFFVNGGTRSMGILLVELMIRFQAPGSVTAIAVGLVAAGFAIFGECSKLESTLQSFL